MNPTLKRLIFVTLLLVLIVGTIMGHAPVLPDVHNSYQIQVPPAGESPAAVQLKLLETLKRPQTPGDGVAS